MLWGGFEGAQRVVFGAFPERQQPDRDSFPVLPLYAVFRKEDGLTHRDFLGALMGLGVNRDTIGDILLEEGRCVLFVRKEISDFITSQLDKVGRAGVRFEEPSQQLQLPEGRGFEEIHATVASERLDCIIAALTNSSREKSASLIVGGAVTLQYETVLSVSAKVSEGEKLSIKGYGKYIVDQMGLPTKKGRLRLIARKYR